MDYPLVDEAGAQYRELELRNTHRDFGRFNRPKLYYPLFVSPDGSVALNSQNDTVEVYPDWEDGFQGCWTWGKEKTAAEISLLVGKKVNGTMKVYRKAYAFADNAAL